MRTFPQLLIFTSRKKKILMNLSNMKVLLAYLASIVTCSPVRTEVIEPSVEYRSRVEEISTMLDCQSQLLSINRHIQNHGTNAKWFKNSDQAMFQKKGCSIETYDMAFCTLVCELQENDWCEPDPFIGEDVCATGLYCSESRICEPIYDEYDYDSSSSDFLNNLFDTLYDQPKTYSRRKHIK